MYKLVLSFVFLNLSTCKYLYNLYLIVFLNVHTTNELEKSKLSLK